MQAFIAHRASQVADASGRLGSIEIVGIPAFSDNYIWLTHNNQSAVVVDPGDAQVTLDALSERNLVLDAVLITHHHPDHTGGLPKLLELFPELTVYGPVDSPCQHVNHALVEGDTLTLLEHRWEVLTLPGHTLDHIAFYLPGCVDARSKRSMPLLFCGDTLFAGGCGRLFEGSPEQMYHSLNKLATLPASTKVFCAHEYTEANLAFAAAVEPKNAVLQARIAAVADVRADNRATVPSTIGDELASNPFMRWQAPAVVAIAEQRRGQTELSGVEVFTEIRRWTDVF